MSDQLTLRSTVLPPQAFNRLYLYNSTSICLGSNSDRLCALSPESVVWTSVSMKAGRNDRHHVLQSLEVATHSGAEVGFVSRIAQGYIIACHCHMLLPLSVPMHSFDCQAATRLFLRRHHEDAGSRHPYTEPPQCTRKGLAPLRNHHHSATALFALRLHSPTKTKARRAAFP